MQARTGGGGAPLLRSAIPYYIAADWEEFADIRAPARAQSQRSRLRIAFSIAVDSVRVALAAGRGGCDKDLSGIVTDGHVFRFVACQFGQKMAGSPLGSIVRAVARFFARLTYPVHVAAWVDDLIFGMSTLSPRR